jgi:hypothetical protein
MLLLLLLPLERLVATARLALKAVSYMGKPRHWHGFNPSWQPYRCLTHKQHSILCYTTLGVVQSCKGLLQGGMHKSSQLTSSHIRVRQGRRYTRLSLGPDNTCIEQQGQGSMLLRGPAGLLGPSHVIHSGCAWLCDASDALVPSFNLQTAGIAM